MLQVWHDASRYRGESSVLTWVLGIAFHKSMDRLRTTCRHEADSLDPAMPDDGAIDVDVVLERMDDIRRVRDAISKLSVIQRTALHLAFHDELQYSQMAKVLGCPEGTVKTRVFHAKQALKRLLAEA
jgi:RNA polymerase sigma-70 factor (ECF subfamily)